jgi:hypothetical protein
MLSMMNELTTDTVDKEALSLHASETSKSSPNDLEKLSSSAISMLTAEIEDTKNAIVPSKVDPLADATLADVEVTPEETNPTTKVRIGALDSSVPCSRLKTIKGLAAVTYSVPQLRSFCSRVPIKGVRKAAKVDLCRLIADCKDPIGTKKLESDPKVKEKNKKNKKNKLDDIDTHSLITSIEDTNASIAFGLVQVAVSSTKFLFDLEERCDTFTSELRKNCDGGKREAKKRLKEQKKRKAKKANIDAERNGSKNKAWDDSSDSESEHSDSEDSQESLLDKILSVKRDIKIFQKHKEYACDQSHAYLLRKTKK